MAKAFAISEFMRNVDVMFDKVEDDFFRIGEEFIAAAAEKLVMTTPGPNLQDDATEYIATGRLRAGWHFGLQAPSSVSREEGGPYDEEGIGTISQLRRAIFSTGAQRISFLWNDVAYGYYVHQGEGNHLRIGPRPWVRDVSLLGQELLEIAMERKGTRS